MPIYGGLTISTFAILNFLTKVVYSKIISAAAWSVPNNVSMIIISKCLHYEEEHPTVVSPIDLRVFAAAGGHPTHLLHHPARQVLKVLHEPRFALALVKVVSGGEDERRVDVAVTHLGGNSIDSVRFAGRYWDPLSC